MRKEYRQRDSPQVIRAQTGKTYTKRFFEDQRRFLMHFAITIEITEVAKSRRSAKHKRTAIWFMAQCVSLDVKSSLKSSPRFPKFIEFDMNTCNVIVHSRE
jgi:hypothetical protein